MGSRLSEVPELQRHEESAEVQRVWQGVVLQRELPEGRQGEAQESLRDVAGAGSRQETRSRLN